MKVVKIISRVLVLIIMFFVPSVNASAQFYTISKERLLFEVVKEEAESEDVEAVKKEGYSENIALKDSIENHGSGGFTQAAMKANVDSVKYWVGALYNVSPPLRQLVVTSPFGRRNNPFKSGKSEFHKGVDYKANADTAMAMFSGIVEKVGVDKRSGVYVVLRHREFRVSYCHLSKACVEKGKTIAAGEVVGITGNTGRSTGPHLHLRTKYKGKDFDPCELVSYVLGVRQEAARNIERLGVEINLGILPYTASAYNP